FRRLDNRRGPFVEILRVLIVSADAGDDEEMRILGRCDRRDGTQCDRDHGRPEGLHYDRPEPRHASPRTRRNPHSAPSRPSSAMRMIGMSQRSRSSTTVTPRPVYVTASGSCAAVAAVKKCPPVSSAMRRSSDPRIAASKYSASPADARTCTLSLPSVFESLPLVLAASTLTSYTPGSSGTKLALYWPSRVIVH